MSDAECSKDAKSSKEGKEIEENGENGEKENGEVEEGGKDEAEPVVPVLSNTEQDKDSNDDQPPSSSFATATTAAGIIAQGDWQAIWSQQHNNYYFHNIRTGETTWSNPLVDPSSSTSSTSTSAQLQQSYEAQQAALAAGIDPDLAYLDPSLSSLPSAAGSSSSTLSGTNPTGMQMGFGGPGFTAKFNSRTGAFTKPTARDPSHLGEWERMQRMSSVYFDMGAYDAEVQQRKQLDENGEGEGEEGKKRKRVSKKDLVSSFSFIFVCVIGGIGADGKCRRGSKNKRG